MIVYLLNTAVGSSSGGVLLQEYYRIKSPICKCVTGYGEKIHESIRLY